MSEKVKLPKEICVLLDRVRQDLSCDSTIIYKSYNKSWKLEEGRLNYIDKGVLMRALVLGYEPEMTPEEQLKELYSTEFPEGTIDENSAFRMAIRETLRIHGIHYDWLDGDAK